MKAFFLLVPCLGALVLTGWSAGPASGADLAALVAQIKAVGAEGAGNGRASAAWKELASLEPSALPALLAALDDASPAAANWLRAAIDAIAEREVAARRPLPVSQLEGFVRDSRHAGAARRLAYEWLVRADRSTPDRLLPGMLNDPGSELRREAVARALAEARHLSTRGDKPAALAAYRKLFGAARDRDQVDAIAKELQALGETADLTAHFGFITQWLLIGPFDNSGGAGFQPPFPPETQVDLGAGYRGKKGMELRWVEHRTTDPYGLVDLNKVLGKNMGAIGYGFAAVNAPAEQVVQVRAGSNNAIKLFLNGKQIFFREEYHHGMRMDQHVGQGTLKPGRNDVLIKICQNEQTDSWAQSWSFQLRLCDALGGALPITPVLSKPGEAPARK